MNKIVAIDYGTRRIGLAISDASRTIALPWTVIEAGKDPVESVVKALTPRLKEIGQLLIGLPLLLSGEVGLMAQEVQRFKERLAAALPSLKIEFFDERLSSRQADRELQSLSLNRKKRSETIDSRAASLFLQSYLDSHRE